MSVKSSVILIGLKMLEDVIDVWIGKVDENKAVNVNGLTYYSKEF